MLSNVERSTECTSLGGNASGLQIAPHSQEELWCLVGACDISSSSGEDDCENPRLRQADCPIPSSSSGGNNTQICKATAGELIEDMESLIVDCTSEKPENSHNYNIEYFETNPFERSFCITGECKEAESSSSSEEESSSSSEEISSSSGYDYDYGGTSCEIPDNEWKHMSGYGFYKKKLYSNYPAMQNASNVRISNCACGVENFFRCTLDNFGYVDDYTIFGLSLCGFSHGYWCNGIESGSCDFSGKSAYIYYSDDPEYGWLVPNIASASIYSLGYRSTNFTLTAYPSLEEILMFEHKYILPFGVSTSDIESAILEAMPAFPSLNRINEYCRGEWYPHDEDCFGTEQEVETALGDSVYFCASLGGKTGYRTELSNRGWCVVGECEFDDISSSSSSEEVSSSSTSKGYCPSNYKTCSECDDTMANPPNLRPVYNCIDLSYDCDMMFYVTSASLGTFNGSTGAPGCFRFTGKSSLEEIKATCQSSCNSITNSSSSATSSSSNYESINSSSSSESSNSNCPSHPLASVPSNPLSACFEKNGTCYKCNSARGNECSNDWLWIYGFVESNVGWWYTEVDCSLSNDNSSSSSEANSSSYNESSSSSATDIYDFCRQNPTHSLCTDIGYPGSSGSSICPSHPLASVPSNPLEACFEKNGTCYKCNSARGNECSNNWLWIYDFVPGNVGWWYEEVSCEEEKNECPDGTASANLFLSKNGVFEDEAETSDYDISYEIWGNKTKFYYDAIGRKTQNDPDTRRYLFEGKGNVQNNKEDLGGISGIGSPISCYKNANGEWVCENNSKLPILRKDAADNCGKIGEDYGIIEADGSMTGGITCPWLDIQPVVHSLKYEKEVGTCADGSRNLQATFNYVYETKLTRNEPLVVPEGYKFPNDYAATKEDVTATQYHELGHVKYNNCIKLNNATLSFSDCICESEAQKRLDDEGVKLKTKTLNTYQKRLDDMRNLFHKEYGNDGYATTYECP